MNTDNPFKGKQIRILPDGLFVPSQNTPNMQNMPRSQCALCEAGIPLGRQHFVIEVNLDGSGRAHLMPDEPMGQVQHQIEAHFDNHITILKNLPK